MPLKGYYMKKLYPAPLMRSCCDLDVWFDPSREKEVKAALGELGFTMKNAGENHMFHTYGAASLEMHYSLEKFPPAPTITRTFFPASCTSAAVYTTSPTKTFTSF